MKAFVSISKSVKEIKLKKNPKSWTMFSQGYKSDKPRTLKDQKK